MPKKRDSRLGVEYWRAASVTEVVAPDSRLPPALKLAVLALVVLTVFVSAVRTVARPQGPLCQPRGLSRWSLLAEVASKDVAKIEVPGPTALHTVLPAIAVIVPMFLLETRRRTLRPVRLHRPKTPPRHAADSVPAH